MAEEMGGNGNVPAQPQAGCCGAPPELAGIYNELLEERDSLRRMRVVSSLTLLAIFLVYMFFIGRMIAGFDSNKFGTALQDSAVQLWPTVKEKAQAAVDANKDEAKRLVLAVARERLPAVHFKINTEFTKLREEALAGLHDKMLSELERQMNLRAEQILKEFPELANDNDRYVVLTRIKTTAKDVADRVISKDLAAVRRSLDGIESTLSRPDIRKRIEEYKTGTKLREKTLGYLLAVLARPLYEGVPEKHMGDIEGMHVDAPAAAGGE